MSRKQDILASKVVSSSLARVLAATVLLAEFPRYSGLQSVDSPMLMRIQFDDAVLLKDKPLWHSCEQAWIGLPCNATDTSGDKRHVDVNSNFDVSLFVGKLIGLILAAVALITSESAWRKFGAHERQLPFFGLHRCSPSTKEEAEIINEEQPAQEELDWISSARIGKIKLTEDVYKAAVQWWLQQPLLTIVDRILPQDQKLLKPVLELSQRGAVKKASSLMVQIGRLDRLDREVRHSSCKHIDESNFFVSSPLSRSAMDAGSSATLMRKAIELHALPDACHHRSAGTVPPHWHVRQKTNRIQIRLGEHPLAGVASQHSSRPLVDSQPRRSSQEDNYLPLYEFSCACGA
mmetsp:Transcript_84293/g.131613  ORF Transcript_84293/g.131613 Transcript_84293/m.131613 type:complete len:348 (+) Transcript_84293:97-1140(+)